LQSGEQSAEQSVIVVILVAVHVRFVRIEGHIAATTPVGACGECPEKFKLLVGRHSVQVDFHFFTFLLREIFEITLCAGIGLGGKFI
jgi:hypothetical protein